MPAAPGATLGNALQSCPHAPQFLGSDCKLTQLDKHESAIGAVHFSTHARPEPVCPQNGVVPSHRVPHEPQLDDSCRSVSQPSSARDEQWSNPEEQPPAGTTHCPPWHSTRSTFTFGSLLQS